MIQIREAVDRAVDEASRLGDWPTAWRGPLTHDEWTLLDKRGDLERFVEGQATLDDLSEIILDNRRTYVPARAAKQKGPSAERCGNQTRRHVHDVALTDAFFADVEQDSTDRFQVRKFRREILAGTLVSDLRRWIQEHVRRQGRPTVENGRVHLVAVRVGDEIVRRATRLGHPLEWLRQMSDALAAFYPWEPADAATYALAGTPPSVRSLSAHVRRTWPVLARSTITVTIGPTATPNEVAAVYSRLRTQEFGRVRRLTPKHAALAAFAFGHSGLSDVEQMNQWNRKQKNRPRWRYRFPSVFRRERDLALGSLLELRPHRSRR